MTKAGKPKARKASPATVLRFVGADGKPVDMPTAEAVVQQIEKAVQLRAQADAEFEWLRAHGPEAEAEAARQRILASARQIRDGVVRQLQPLIDTAVHRLRTVQIAEQNATQTRKAAGAPTRQQFADALAAITTSGTALTAPNLLNHWPTQSPPRLRRVQELLQEHRRAFAIRPPDEAR